jgi:cytochrome c biogenesis protein CcdA
MLGIFAAITMSIGMGVTISIVGILSVLFANKTNNFVYSKGHILQIVSGVLIILLGIFLLLSNVTIK